MAGSTRNAKNKNSGSEGEEQTSAILTALENIRKELKLEIHDSKTSIMQQLGSIQTKVDQLEAENTQMKKEVQECQKTLEYWEKRMRMKNLVLTGVEEAAGENTINMTNEILQSHLGVAEKIETAFRIGRPKPQGSRPIKVIFFTTETRNRVLKEAKKLKGTKIYLNPDLSLDELKKNEVLRKFKREAEQEGKMTYYRKGKLYIDDQPYGVEGGKVVPLGY